MSKANNELYIGRIKALEGLNAMTPREFEAFVGKLFRWMGYNVSVTGASSDEGVDLFLEKEGRKAIVQCKKHEGSIGQPVVRDFYGTMVHNKANQGFIVTTGTFSLPAQTWAKGKQIHLVDGAELLDWLESLPEGIMALAILQHAAKTTGTASAPPRPLPALHIKPTRGDKWRDLKIALIILFIAALPALIVLGIQAYLILRMVLALLIGK